MTRIAIIGAGLAGLTLARELKNSTDITVFEKSAGVGGRMATRSAPPYAFDHGAQFFIAKSAAFQEEVAKWLEAGVVDLWQARFREFEGDQVVSGRDWCDDPPHYVGVPGMN
ncbi:MAG: FAD-dependent oxidoreductase, partial [Gammaproteobacteria bacterium]